MQLIIAEKPSVARDLARVLGVRAAGRTQYEGEGRVITWCVGHLVELEEPAAYDPRWKHWRLDTLPMVPERFKLRPATQAPEQWRAVRGLLREARFNEVVNACDAGREGELIFRYVYELAGARLPVRRLWISSLTDEAIRDGVARLRPGRDYEPLAAAARCRSEADWLVGMNATRAVTARYRASSGAGGQGALYSIGRVQTPTLAMLVARERAVRGFVPRDYWQARATLRAAPPSANGASGAGAGASTAGFTALWTHAGRPRLATGALAEALVARCRSSAGADGLGPHGPRVETVRTRRQREPPPMLFDLTSLQRTANKRFGMTAARTLEVAQALYETHKVLTYPRTDSRHLTSDMVPRLPGLFSALEAVPAYAPFAGPLAKSPPRPPRRVVDDSRVQDHHAIVPTGKALKPEALSPEEKRIFDLVARRFLGAFYPDAEFDQTEVTVLVGPGTPAPHVPHTSGAGAGAGADEKHQGKSAAADDPARAPHEALPPPPDRFVARGRVRVEAGWQAVLGFGDEPAVTAAGPRAGGRGEEDPEAEADESLQQTLPKLAEGQRLEGEFEPLAKQTRPPSRYTEATLLAGMESAGKAIEDDALRAAMKDCGLGTPATRAAVIETLLKRGFVAREKKHVVPTAVGVALIEALPVESLASPELTGAWESRLARVARGEESREAFMADIARYVRELVDTVRAAGAGASAAMAAASAAGAAGATGAPVGKCPRCGAAVVERARAYACSGAAAPCGFALPKLVARRAVSPALAGVLLSRGRTQALRGFKSKAGRPFQAALVLEPDGTVRFDFDTTRPPPASPTRPPTAPPTPTPTAAPPAASTPTAAAPAAAPAAAAAAGQSLLCPRCRQGTLVTGRRAWGCSRWREGCGFVVAFEALGKRLTFAQLRELITRGRTRKARWSPDGGDPVEGRLILDPHAPPQGASVRLERA